MQHRIRPLVASVFALAAACGEAEGVPENEFIENYNTFRCDHILRCAGEATLTFDGIDSQEECVIRNADAVYQWGRGCTYSRLVAEQCLLGLENLACPTTGGVAPVPEVCNNVYSACATGGDDTGGGGGNGGAGDDSGGADDSGDTGGDTSGS